MRIPRGVPALLGCILGWTVLWVDVLLTPGVPAQERAFALRTAVWDTRDIPVCWENPTEAGRQGRQWTREAVQDTWERASQVRFIGWQTCLVQSRGIRIWIADEGPHVERIGKQLDGVPAGMILNFTFRRWGLSCAQTQEHCIKTLAVHEFGHALALSMNKTAPTRPQNAAPNSRAQREISWRRRMISIL